ncbi:hypothetical protein LB542_05220 [Mesorhizobium sp. BR1-1-9]|uniref:hypothetical protein n=1 Tax=Mesorhizobium sp. BR1-1-9 TaxID=2876646 RepID=UPI001CD0463D|nr:hypothetical protein [Mesorhizobium sp. BR1-1-9]MBZ9870263.1 hypothetical protein [Mesorhizobium sp. BR1-1-9]
MDRVDGKYFEYRTAPAKPDHFDLMNRGLPGGICPAALDLLSDCAVLFKIFGLLRQVVPVEIAKQMIALGSVKLRTRATS